MISIHRPFELFVWTGTIIWIVYGGILTAAKKLEIMILRGCSSITWTGVRRQEELQWPSKKMPDLEVGVCCLLPECMLTSPTVVAKENQISGEKTVHCVVLGKWGHESVCAREVGGSQWKGSCCESIRYLIHTPPPWSQGYYRVALAGLELAYTGQVGLKLREIHLPLLSGCWD